MFLHFFDFFAELILSNIVETSKFVDLTQGQFGLAQVSQSGLRVILRNILIGLTGSLV